MADISPLQALVAKGALLLDAQNPTWFLRVNPDTLDMWGRWYGTSSHDLKDDLFTMVFGSFEKGLEVLSIDIFTAQDHGFDLASPFRLMEQGIDGRVVGHQDLTETWKEAIKTRLSATSST
jgi:hypothetical protein